MHKNRRPDSERISIAELRKRFKYDKKNGGLHRIGHKKGEAKKCGTVKTTGYVFVRITHDGSVKDYSMHSLVWAWHMGYWAKELDHTPDPDKKNNRIENLRECTHHENMLAALAHPIKRSDGVEYESLTLAARVNHLCPNEIRKAILGIKNTHGGYGWSYA